MCSGADPELLAQCGKSEQIKQAGIGGTVFFTALMAAISGAFALFTVFDTLFPAIFFGLIWGLLIFNLDRFIVSTIKKQDRPGREFIQAIPRIILAVIIAVVISKPLELKLFEKEIDRVLLEEKNQMTLDNREQLALQYTPQIEKLEAEVSALKQEITDKETEVNALYDTYIAEAEGREGTLKIGKGPVYAEKREKHDATLQALQELRQKNNELIDQNEKAITALRTEYTERVSQTQPVIERFDGLMARVGALDKLPWLPSFFIFLLFLAVETAPILAKLLAPKGEYDQRLSDQEATVSVWVEQKQLQREHLFQTDADMTERVYEDLKQEDELFRYKRGKARELMQFQADAFFEQQSGSL